MTRPAIRAAPDDPLTEYLRTNPPAAPGDRGEALVQVRREPSRFASSYRAEVVTVELASGDQVRLFLKDFGTSSFPKDDAAARRERELHVYRDLLPTMGLGTARYHGSLWDHDDQRFWLLLEFLGGSAVSSCPLEAWIAAAGWVGRLHGTRHCASRLEDSPLLIRHDETHLRHRAELARHDVARFGPPLRARLERVLRSYERMLDALIDDSPCLVHGGYRPENVQLVPAPGGGCRVCPLDWEMAAIGSPLHDLAILLDGFETPQLDLLLGAYVAEAVVHGATIPPFPELRRLFDGFRLQRVINNLGRARRSGYREARVSRLLQRAEALAEVLDSEHPRAFGGPVGPAPGNHEEPRLPRLLGVDGARGTPELEACLREVLGVPSLRVTGHERLKAGVHRLRVGVRDEERSLIAKWCPAEVARRSWLVARRWLAAVGVEDVGPSMLAVAAERSGERAWQIQDDLGGRPVCRRAPERAEIEALMDAIARVHTALSEHRLLAECRLAGGDRGIEFYAANLRDAQRVLRAVDARRHGAEAASLRDGLLQRMQELQEQQPARARALIAGGGPETLLHGDLWTTNALVLRSDDQLRVRLVDWDEAAVGPIAFDLSTLLLRFEPPHRARILDAYREAADRLAGWELPPDDVLNPALETAAVARLVSLLVWSVAAALDDDSGWLPVRLAELVDWLDGVGPVLPPR